MVDETAPAGLANATNPAKTTRTMTAPAAHLRTSGICSSPDGLEATVTLSGARVVVGDRSEIDEVVERPRLRAGRRAQDGPVVEVVVGGDLLERPAEIREAEG